MARPRCLFCGQVPARNLFGAPGQDRLLFCSMTCAGRFAMQEIVAGHTADFFWCETCKEWCFCGFCEHCAGFRGSKRRGEYPSFSKAAKCMFDGCDKPAKYRGLCLPHYHLIRTRIRAGEISDWDEARLLGLCAARMPGHGAKASETAQTDTRPDPVAK